MSPYRIEMCFVGYTEDKELLYKVRVFDKNGNVILSFSDIPKERAVRCIMEYCYDDTIKEYTIKSDFKRR